jgi:hypothetical protein
MQGCVTYFLQSSDEEIDRKPTIQLPMFNMRTYISTHTLHFFDILYTNLIDKLIKSMLIKRYVERKHLFYSTYSFYRLISDSFKKTFRQLQRLSSIKQM